MKDKCMRNWFQLLAMIQSFKNSQIFNQRFEQILTEKTKFDDFELCKNDVIGITNLEYKTSNEFEYENMTKISQIKAEPQRTDLKEEQSENSLGWNIDTSSMKLQQMDKLSDIRDIKRLKSSKEAKCQLISEYLDDLESESKAKDKI